MYLTDCFVELFAYMRHFLNQGQQRQPPYREVRDQVVRLLQKSESKLALASGRLSREEFDSARFALCAWIDEAVATSGWDQKHQWLKEQLQLVYFNTTAAGKEFFDRLAELGLHRREVREIYYLCLVLGFTGRYCHPGEAHQLEQLKTDNLKLLLGSEGLSLLDRTELFPEAFPSSSTAARVPAGSRLPSLTLCVAVAAPILLFACLFVVYRLVLNTLGEHFLKAVQP